MVWPNFLTIFGILEVIWTTVAKFYWVMTKTGRDIGLQSWARFAGSYTMTRFFDHLLNPWDHMDRCVQGLLSYDQNWPRYSPSKLCKIRLLIRCDQIFWPFLACLRSYGSLFPSFFLVMSNTGRNIGLQSCAKFACSYCLTKFCRLTKLGLHIASNVDIYSYKVYFFWSRDQKEATFKIYLFMLNLWQS